MDDKSISFIIILGGENISIGGQVDYLRCDSCMAEAFDLSLHADTDMIYQGVVGLVDIAGKRLVITRLTSKEYNEYHSHIPTALERRINEVFNSDAFTHFTYQHFVDPKTSQKVYGRKCRKCFGHLRKVESGDFASFVKAGGQILALEGDYRADNF